MRKICLVAHLSDLSGANMALVRLCIILKSEGIDFVVLVPRKGLLSKKLEQESIPYKVFFYTTWIDKKYSIKKYMKCLINVFASARFAWFCIFNHIGIVHYNSITVGMGAKLLSIMRMPYIWHIREVIDESIYQFHNRNKMISCINSANELIFVSNSIKEKYTDVFLNQKQNIIYDGVNITDMNCYDAKDYSNIIMVGGVEKNKGQDQAIRALAQMLEYKEVCLYIVGPINDHEYYKELNTLIEKNELMNRVIFTGYTPDVDSYRKKCGTALICSEYESFGLAAVEAMNTGEFVIGANTGGTKEILENGRYGQLYSYGNVKNLIKTLEWVLNERGNLKEKVDAAHVYVKYKFSDRKNADLVTKIYMKWI